MTSTLGHDRWLARDRLFAAVLVVYLFFGFAHNYVRTSPRVGDGVRVPFAAALMVFLGLALLFFAWQIVRRRCSLEALGFTVGTRRSLALTAVVGAYLAASLMTVPLTRAAFTAGMAVPFLAVLLEEILVRPVMITWWHDRLATRQKSGSPFTIRHSPFHHSPWALAVVLSAAIWVAVHLPSKSPFMLVGLFIAAIVLGALYVWSGTNVTGYVLHAFANTGGGGAVMMFALCLVLGVIGWVIERKAAPGPRSLVQT